MESSPTVIRLAVIQHSAWEADPLATARGIIVEAENQARLTNEQILAEGNVRAAAAEENGYARGLRQGRIDSILAHLSLGGLQATLITSAQEALISVVETTCREILKSELSVQRQAIVQRVQAAVAQYPELSIELCATGPDVELLKQELSRLEPDLFCRAQSISFRIDPLLQTGSVRLESKFGHLVASPGEHLQAIIFYLRQPGAAFAQFVTALLHDRLQADGGELCSTGGPRDLFQQGRTDDAP